MVSVALIPARGGSRGLAGKNLAPVRGRSLVARAVEVARAVSGIDAVVVSSDDDAILEEGRRAGATVTRRPAELATDEATTDAVVRHFLTERPDVDVLVLLQPTSPLREPQDVRRCLDALAAVPTAATVAPAGHPAEWLFRLTDGSLLEPLLGWDRLVGRRQDAEPAYALNGAVYAARADHLRAGGKLVGPDTVAVPMPAERSVDVDDRIGLALASVLSETHDEAAPVVLFGGGGHARAVADVLGRMAQAVAAVVDPASVRHGNLVVLRTDEEGASYASGCGHAGALAIGDNHRRLALAHRLEEWRVPLPPIVARTATVAVGARLGAGTVVMEHGHIGPAATLGRACLVNTGADVEHDAALGDGVHCAPGSVLGGGVECEDEVLVGAGAVVLPGVRIGMGATIAAGAVVVEAVAAGETVAGVPARPLTGARR
jgi:sugar O-acyltransferase (sialic acid O-acetyltransferase NeuD family)